MERTPLLLPYPQQLNLYEGIHIFNPGKLLLLDSAHPQSGLFTAKRIQESIRSSFGFIYEITSSNAVPIERVGIIIRIILDSSIRSQGYRLTVNPEVITIEANNDQGLFYGCITLSQLIQYYNSPSDTLDDKSIPAIPCMDIIDWPDFDHRGVLLDISRDKVPTMDTLYSLVDMLVSWKINQLQLYTEHTFAYQRHPEVWKDASPFTGEQILLLDSFCRERFVELVPNQNSFGHLEHWLCLPKYNDLAEAPDGFDFPWEHHSGPFSLNPLDPRSIKLISGLYDELLPHFSSHQINVGCDETFDLGQGRSKDACAQLGTGRVYLDFLLKIYHEVTLRGFSMQFWGDIVMHYPDLISELPKNSTALEWGYEANHPFEEHGKKFAAAGIPFYVCPGTSSWNSIAGRTDNCLQNLSNAAINGHRYGAKGYLITDWGDDGHWQMLPVSYLGFAAGAAYSWSYKSNSALDIKAALDLYGFNDTSGNLGRIAYDLGNIYQDFGVELDNDSVFFIILQKPFAVWRNYLPTEITEHRLDHIFDTLDRLEKDLSIVTSQRADHKLILHEFELTIAFLRHACKRALFLSGRSTISKKEVLRDLMNIIVQYKDIWLSRNRPGGLRDSLAHFDVAHSDYQ